MPGSGRGVVVSGRKEHTVAGGGGDRGLAGRQRPREAGGGRRAVSGGSGKEAAGSGRQFQVNKVKWHPPAKEGLGGHSSPGEPR